MPNSTSHQSAWRVKRAAALFLISSAACGAFVLAPGSVALGANASASKVYIAANGCTGSSFKPAKVILACADANLYVASLKYKSYGSSSASATGTFHYNTCTPNCAAGKFKTQSGSVSFSAVVSCSDGRRYFSSARYSYGKQSGTDDIKPTNCSNKKKK